MIETETGQKAVSVANSKNDGGLAKVLGVEGVRSGPATVESREEVQSEDVNLGVINFIAILKA